MPLAGLGLVDHDDVGQLGQRKQIVRCGARRRGVDDDHRARGARDPRRGDGGGDRDLQLQQHDIAVGDDGADVGGVHAQMRVGARRHDDGVLRGGVDDDDRRTARARDVDHAVEPDLVGTQMRAQLVGGRIAAERRDELHGRARPGRRDGLIAALASR